MLPLCDIGRQTMNRLSVALLLFTFSCTTSTTQKGELPSASANEGLADVFLLPDALLLEPGAPAWQDASGQDVNPEAPSSVSDSPSLELDESSDIIEELETASAYEISDVSPPQDIAKPPPDTLPPQTPCDPCGPKESCVKDEKTGLHHCVFVAECSEVGLYDLEDLSPISLASASFYVKVKAKVWAGSPTCSLLPCFSDNPCCNTCFAPLYIGSEKFPIILLGQGTTFGCEGSECDFSDHCSPLVPGSKYLIWGTLKLGLSLELYVDSFCPAEEDHDGN